MQDILSDSLWQFVGAIAAIIAVFISVGVYIKQRRIKNLSFQIVSRTPLLSMSDELDGVLQIQYDGVPVQQVHLIVIKFINSGNVSILASDYERAISINFGKEAQILTAEIVETNPDTLEPSLINEDNSVQITPILLNKNDTFSIKMLVCKFEDEINFDGRIIGVERIKRAENVKTSHLVIMLIGLLVTFYGVFQMPINFTLGFIIFIIGYGLTAAIIYGNLRNRKFFFRILRTMLSD
jgi:hypothetical protein